MKRKFLSLVIILAASLAGSTSRAATPAQASPAADLLAALPQADAVMFIDMRRLLSETLPAMLAEHPDLRRQVETTITQVGGLGLDLRAVDSLAVAVRFNSSVPVAFIRGRFDAERLAATAFRDARRQTLGARTVYTNSGRREVWATVALDANTVALGEIELLRAGVESFEGRGRVQSEMVAQATRSTNAVAGFSARVPSSLAQSFGGSNRELSQLLAGIQQVSGSFVPTESGGGELSLRVRAENADQAAELGALLRSLKEAAAPLAGSRTEGTSVALPGLGLVVSSSLMSLVRDITIATEGVEVSINANFTQGQISELLRALAAPPAPPPPAPAPQATRP